MGLLDAMGQATKLVIGTALAILLGLTGVFMVISRDGGAAAAVVGVVVIIIGVGFWMWGRGA